MCRTYSITYGCGHVVESVLRCGAADFLVVASFQERYDHKCLECERERFMPGAGQKYVPKMEESLPDIAQASLEMGEDRKFEEAER